MGRRGPHPKTEAELKARGSTLAGRRKEIHLPIGDLTPPKTLTAQEKKIFIALATDLQKLGVVACTDSHALEVTAKTMALLNEARTHLKKSGMFTTNKAGRLVESEPMKTVKGLSDQVFKMLERLGLSPEGRARMNTKPVEGEGPNSPTGPEKSGELKLSI